MSEVRKESLVLQWRPPVYQGRDPVNGFYIDIKETEAPEEAWRGVNEKATNKTYMQVHMSTSRGCNGSGTRGGHFSFCTKKF